ncbi:uncharacterized protein LOC132619775 [Lycium barbarum]|uniref:uncharacterized protein LOC132619775 n=1 Tax=Lycium barbarum TaxID=112863 RepID=UPI00293F72B3|nr:uncharacterized protein LOC132619775 [Lycium barbarum]
MEPFQDATELDCFRRRLEHQSAFANCTGKIWLFVMEEWEVHLVEDHAQHLTIRVVHQQRRQEALVSMVGSDFNVVLYDEEKLGGLSVLFQKTEDFAACINDCHLYDLGYIGSTFTWWNGRSDAATISKRLDRILSNQKMIDQAPQMIVTHLIKKGSDHSPHELQIRQETERIIKPFKCLNFSDFSGNPFLIFQHKLKKLRRGLMERSKGTYGNIFQKVTTLEEVILAHESQFEADPSMENRAQLHRVQAELSKYLHLEEAYLRQKSGMKWFKDGDRNTRFFHSYVNGRRKKLRLTNIQNGDGEWLNTNQHVPTVITKEHNHELVDLPSEEEIKSTSFGLSGDSASRADGFTGCFCQHCWNIVKEDIINMVRALFVGYELPKFITHTNLVLLPKNDIVETFFDLRLISLSNFSNKIISRVLHERLVQFLPLLISSNQSGFVKGGSIVKNVLLAQEIVRDISKRTKTANMVVKLDMMKAYDRVSWLFLTKVVSSNWYSVLINGKPHGFYTSSRGVKQGDPLSPILFIISAEVLSRKKESVKLMMKKIQQYEKVSGQLVNLIKSAFYVNHKVYQTMVRRIMGITKIRKGSFPFTCLSCPLYYGRNKIAYYDDIIKKIGKRIQSWHGKMLSYGGRVVLISNVLQSMPLHILSTMSPPIGVIRHIRRLLARFFWNYKSDTRCRHWIKWEAACLPKEEGVLGFRSVFEMSNSLFCKLGWNLRTKPSLWASFMINKYCKKLHPLIAITRGGSCTWKKMILVRDLVEHQIWWQIRQGDASFEFDNWTSLGALYHVVEENHTEEEIEVKQFSSGGEWDLISLRE